MRGQGNLDLNKDMFLLVDLEYVCANRVYRTIATKRVFSR